MQLDRGGKLSNRLAENPMEANRPIKRRPGSKASHIAAVADACGVTFQAARHWFYSGRQQEHMLGYLSRRAMGLPMPGPRPRRTATEPLPPCLL
jgi:hypothetical protein